MPEVRHTARAPLALLAGGVVAVGLLLMQNPHESSHLLPRCPFRALTGLQCPACGGTRMAYDLLHLDLAAAWRDNALLLLAAPLVIWWLVAGVTGRTCRVALGSRGLGVVLATAVTWAVARNIA